jgi:hypothetical protein
MTTTDYNVAFDKLRQRGVYNFSGAETLWKVVKNSVIYRYRRDSSKAWQYEVTMEGYGKPPKMKNWIDVSIMPPVDLDK